VPPAARTIVHRVVGNRRERDGTSAGRSDSIVADTDIVAEGIGKCFV
jgi:hypothetical protein